MTDDQLYGESIAERERMAREAQILASNRALDAKIGRAEAMPDEARETPERRALRELVEAARLPRKALLYDGDSIVRADHAKGIAFRGNWIIVPREDVDELCVALARAEAVLAAKEKA